VRLLAQEGAKLVALHGNFDLAPRTPFPPMAWMDADRRSRW
jgi:hypothetical protein